MKEARGAQPPSPLKGIRVNLSTIILLVSVMFFVFVSRVIYAPLLPSIERDLGLSHAQSTSFFLLMTLGYITMNLFSGFFASRLGHRFTIFLALLIVSAATAIVAASTSLLFMKAGLMLVGAGSGLYPPSGIATASALVDLKDEGKMLSIHESGPNFGFIAAPLIAALFLPRIGWRNCLVLLSLSAVAFGVLFIIFSRGGRFRGEPPKFHNITRIISIPSFWVAALLLALGVGGSVGLYSILPAYLVSERGMNQGSANTIVSVSRIGGLIALVAAGYMVDRFGAKKTIAAIFLSAGIATLATSFRFSPILIAGVFLQPLFIVGFAPAFMTAAARIAPRNFQNLTISFALPIGYGFGAGVLPQLLGWLGDNASFSLGLLLYGFVLIAGSALPFLLRLQHTELAVGQRIPKA